MAEKKNEETKQRPLVERWAEESKEYTEATFFVKPKADKSTKKSK